MIKYVISPRYSDAKITTKEIIRETAHQIVIAGRGRRLEVRESKMSEYAEHYDTWDEAHGRLMAIAEEKLNSARRMLQNAQGFHGNVKGMKRP